MGQDLDSKHQEWLIAIGKQVRILRKQKANLSYIKFAEAVNMDKKTYYRIERAEGDFNISSLYRIISYYPNLSFSKFFKQAGI